METELDIQSQNTVIHVIIEVVIKSEHLISGVGNGKVVRGPAKPGQERPQRISNKWGWNRRPWGPTSSKPALQFPSRYPVLSMPNPVGLSTLVNSPNFRHTLSNMAILFCNLFLRNA